MEGYINTLSTGEIIIIILLLIILAGLHPKNEN